MTMDLTNNSVSDLFAQLGLPNEEQDIQQFAAAHRPLMGDGLLHEAPFWNDSQADFLREQHREDAAWAPAVDQLNLMLHG
jgi:hypothetical protein